MGIQWVMGQPWATMGNHREEAGSLGPIFHDLDVPSCSTDFPWIFHRFAIDIWIFQ
jgi:hypothetical protein